MRKKKVLGITQAGEMSKIYLNLLPYHKANVMWQRPQGWWSWFTEPTQKGENTITTKKKKQKSNNKIDYVNCEIISPRGIQIISNGKKIIQISDRYCSNSEMTGGKQRPSSID